MAAIDLSRPLYKRRIPSPPPIAPLTEEDIEALQRDLEAMAQAPNVPQVAPVSSLPPPEAPYTAYRGAPLVGLPDIGGAFGAGLGALGDAAGRVVEPFTALAPLAERAVSPFPAAAETIGTGLGAAAGRATAPVRALAPLAERATAPIGPAAQALGTGMGRLGREDWARIEAPLTAPRPEGPGYTGYGARPLTGFDALGNIAKAYQEIVEPPAGLAAAAVESLRPLPEVTWEEVQQGTYKLPGTALKEIGKRAKEQNPTNAEGWYTAIDKAAGEYERERAGLFPGEKFIWEAIWDPVNLVFMGVPQATARGVTALARGGARVAARAGEYGSRAVGAAMEATMRPGARTVRAGRVLEMGDIDDTINRLADSLDSETSEAGKEIILDQMGKLQDLKENLSLIRSITEEAEPLADDIAALRAALEESPLKKYLDIIPTRGAFAGNVPETISVATYKRLIGRNPKPSNVTKGRVEAFVALDEPAAEAGMSVDQFSRELENLYHARRRLRDMEAMAQMPGRRIAAEEAEQVGGVQASMGLGEKPPQGTLFENLSPEGGKLPLASPGSLAAQEEARRLRALGQQEFPAPEAPAGAARAAEPPVAAAISQPRIRDTVAQQMYTRIMRGLPSEISEEIDNVVAIRVGEFREGGSSRTNMLRDKFVDIELEKGSATMENDLRHELIVAYLIKHPNLIEGDTILSVDNTARAILRRIDARRAEPPVTAGVGEVLPTGGGARIPPEPGRAALNEANPERHAAWQMRNSEMMSPTLRKSLTDQPETLIVFHDAARDAAADAMIASDPATLVSRLLTAERWSDVDTVAAYKMMRNLFESGLADEGDALARRLAQEGTPTARQLRAFGFVHLLSPENTVVMAKRNFQKLMAKKGTAATKAKAEKILIEHETARIKAETADRLAAVRQHLTHRRRVEQEIADAIGARRPMSIRAFREGIESLLTDEAGAIRLSRQNPVELPVELMEPMYQDALRIKGLAAGPEKEIAKDALRARLNELEQVYGAGRQEMSAYASMDKAIDTWNARVTAQDAAKLARQEKQVAEATVKQARDKLKKASADEAMLARRELAVALKEVRAIEQVERKAQTALAAAEKKLSYITEADARVIQKRIQTDEQRAINFLRQQVRTGDIEVDRALAESFFERAKALQSLPDPDRHWAAQALMNDIAKIIPPSGWDIALNTLGLSRSLKASMDLSFPLRQGAFQWTRKEWRSMFGEQIRAFASEDVARAAENRILFGQFGKVRAASGLEFIDRTGPLYQLEETFFSQYARKIPLVKQSERAYITAGNVLRADVWDGIVRKWLPPNMQKRAFETLDELIEATGKTQRDFENLSKWLNVTTGRGDVPWLRSNIKLLNALFFAPRFFISRLQVLPTAVQIAVQSPALRLEVARDLTGFVAGNMALLAILKASGVGEVELNPRSSDFGKGRIGPVRFDFWGGFQPIARYTAQIIMGEGKSTGTGRIYPKERVVGEGGRGTLFDFIRTKLSPTVGTATDITAGQTITGEPLKQTTLPFLGEVPEGLQTPLGIARELAADFVPFLPASIWQAWQETQSLGGMAAAIPVTAAVGAAELFGGAAQAYHSVRDIQDKVTATGDYTDIYGNKAQKYLDLGKTEREKVNESTEVKAELALQDAKESGRKPRYIEAMETWERDKEELEAELRKHIDAGASGEALREAIKSMNEGRYQRAQSVFKDEVRAEMEAGIVKETKDVLREEYWSVEVPKDYKTGDLDFKARDRGRAEVLAKADRMGVPRSYVLDRGQRFKDSEVRRVMEEYDRDMEILRPYWEARDHVMAQSPLWAIAQQKHDALANDPEGQKEFDRTNYNWRLYRRELDLEHYRLRANNSNGIQAAGLKWEYFTAKPEYPGLRPPEPPKPPVPPLPPLPPLQRPSAPTGLGALEGLRLRKPLPTPVGAGR